MLHWLAPSCRSHRHAGYQGSTQRHTAAGHALWDHMQPRSAVWKPQTARSAAFRAQAKTEAHPVIKDLTPHLQPARCSTCRRHALLGSGLCHLDQHPRHHSTPAPTPNHTTLAQQWRMTQALLQGCLALCHESNLMPSMQDTALQRLRRRVSALRVRPTRPPVHECSSRLPSPQALTPCTPSSPRKQGVPAAADEAVDGGVARHRAQLGVVGPRAQGGGFVGCTP